MKALFWVSSYIWFYEQYEVQSPRCMQHCMRVYWENLPLVSSNIIKFFTKKTQNGNIGKSTIFEFQFWKDFLMQIYFGFFYIQ